LKEPVNRIAIMIVKAVYLALSSLSLAHSFTPIKPFALSSSASSFVAHMSKPQAGDIVTTTYSITPNDDFVPAPLFDDGTVTFALHKGNYLPGLHTALSTMEPGDTKSDLILDAGWGERRDELVVDLPVESSGLKVEELKIGMELYMANGMSCRITKVNADASPATFTIDANPKLAGATYTATVTLDDVKTGPSDKKFEYTPMGMVAEDDSPYEVMTIALGCFWGGELEYMRVPGVVRTSVGFTQGAVENPTYDQVCSGTTGHTEAIQVIYDPSIVAFKELVQLGMDRLGESKFLLNQVGNDRGTQYRHGIYYHDDVQWKEAQEVIEVYGDKCQTEVKPAEKYYAAEDYHQQYLLKGGQSARKDAKEVIRCYG